MATKRQRRIAEQERHRKAYEPPQRRPSKLGVLLRRVGNRLRRLFGIRRTPTDNPAAPNDHLRMYGWPDWVDDDSSGKR